MNELEEEVSIMYDRISQKEYLSGKRECDNCNENKQLFLYSKKSGKVLCAECVLKEIKKALYVQRKK